jgi:hypothetical protein
LKTQKLEQPKTTAREVNTRRQQHQRKENKGSEKPAKKTRSNYDVKKYITCKRWREQEAEDEKEKEGECQLDKQDGGQNQQDPPEDSPVNGEQTGH